MNGNRVVVALGLVVIASGALAAGAQSAPRTAVQTVEPAKGANPDALLLADFKKRVDEYLKIHDKAAKDTPAVKETHDPAEIKRAQDTLGARIRELRADAKPGDILTPDIAAHLRKLLAPQLKHEDGKDAKEILKDDAPAAVPFKVNAKYPASAPLPTVPTTLLTSLPTLPKQVEYRIIGKHLILRDVDADIILDYALNVIR